MSNIKNDDGPVQIEQSPKGITEHSPSDKNNEQSNYNLSSALFCNEKKYSPEQQTDTIQSNLEENHSMPIRDIHRERKELCQKESKEVFANLQKDIRELLLTINNSQETREQFDITLQRFCEKWLVRHAANSQYSDGNTLARRIVSKLKTEPFIIALMGDNLQYFMDNNFSNINEKISFGTWWLEAACLCGAEKITDYLLTLRKEGRFKCGTVDHALSYAASTGKGDFAYKLARYFKDAGEPIDPLAALTYSTLDKDGHSIGEVIADMFEQQTIKNL